MSNFNNQEFQNMIKEYNEFEKNISTNIDLYNTICHKKTTKLIEYITTNLSQNNKYAYYFCGRPTYDPKYIDEWFSSAFDELQYKISNHYRDITFADWLDKINKGVLSETDIEEIYETFEGLNECGSIFTYIKICKDDNLSERIKETQSLLVKFAKENDYDINDDIILNESQCHFYFKIGVYYVFGVNLDGPFDTFKYIQKKLKKIENI
jgi:hypothetical protein